MNKTGQTFKKGRGLWTTQSATNDDWTWLLQILNEPAIIGAMIVSGLPVIEF